MPIISSDYDGSTQYSFAASGYNVVLKANTVYNYTGFGGAFLMNSYYDHFLVAGLIYSASDGISYSSYGSYIDVAATGMVIGTGGYGIRFVADTGSVTINNLGTISGQGAIDGEDASGYIYIYNSGLIQSTREYTAAIYTGSAGDRIVNTGTIIGNISTGAGNDTIETQFGTLSGFIDGGAGSDTYTVAAGQIVREGFYYQADGDDGAVDTVNSYGDYTLGQNIENLTLLGDATIGRGNEANNYLTGNDNGNRLFGGGGFDTLQAGSGDDVLRGGEGNDFLYSLEGTDTFFGGTGDDLVYIGVDQARVVGGTGLDTVAFLFNDTAITVDLTLATGKVTGGAAALVTLSSIEGVWGTEFVDKMTGDAAANNFLGYLGNDIINGGGGDDVIEGFDGKDKLDGGTGIDTLSFANDIAGVTVSLLTNTGTAGTAAGESYVGFENIRGGYGVDMLTGSAEVNVLEGGAGADVLNAGGQKDTLYGDAGDDQLIGGGAGDLFCFRDLTTFFGGPLVGGFGQDTITDFQDGVDRISFVGSSAVDGLADLTISQSGTSTVLLVTGTTDQITLLNFNAANFNSADVIFG